MTRSKPLAFSSLALLATLAACAEAPAPRVSGARVFYSDTQGRAATCTAPQDVATRAGQTAEASMTLVNDGGWCGIPVSNAGRPYSAGLVTTRPANGRLLVRKVGDVTRVDYFPNAGYGGADAFAVRLIPGDAVLRVAVTVQGGNPAAAQPVTTPAAAVPRAPARAPARRR